MDRMQVFSREELIQIHSASMDILEHTGIVFNSDEAQEVFARRGFKIDGSKVFITEKDVNDALDAAPGQFVIQARNRDRDVVVGMDDFIFLPTGGSPNIFTADGVRRHATLEDYENCCRMVHTSDQLDMNGWIMVQPSDLPPETTHLDMLLANMTLSDKAYMGASTSRVSAEDCLEMAAIMWGGPEAVRRQPVMGAVINALSPLRYSTEETGVMIRMAEMGQPVVITNLVMGGLSGPISLPGLMAQANAEILAGVVLAQLAGPGTPVVYGSVSAPTDMRSINSAVGAPEAVVLASATIQMARFYNLPCRTGGALTNSHCVDAQAAAEGTLMLSTAVRSGANFIYHACGQLGSYLSMSLEKWLVDEEVCRAVRRILQVTDISVASIDVETIKSVGNGGNYLTHETTFLHCRDLYMPDVFTRDDYHSWQRKGSLTATDMAAQTLPKRLASYEKPAIDQGLEQELIEYVARKKKEYLGE